VSDSVSSYPSCTDRISVFSETNYKAYLTHLSVLFLLLSQPELIKNPAKSSATYLTETRQTLLDLAASDRFSRKERAPLVALLAIETRLRDMNLRIDADTQSGTSREEVLQRYLDEYGHKGCVRDDLVACLNPSGAGDLSQISVSLEQMASAEHVSTFHCVYSGLDAERQQTIDRPEAVHAQT
jgi:hypothetical protein